ncbi:MAG: HNH endonuclease [Gammaproteobacteria bacterium]|nr:HNH endonuclease [Gammaproteobacteria bacterium]
MSVLDEEYIASQATKKYGISFEGAKDEYDGEIFSVVRPVDLNKPNGFAIAIAKTTRVMEASFRADNFSGGLLRSMGDADSTKVQVFCKALDSLSVNCNIELSINGDSVDKISEAYFADKWNSLEFICDRRLAREAKDSQDALNKISSAFVIDLLGIILCLLELEDISDELPIYERGLPEGAKVRVEVNKYERNPINRATCISHYGAKCHACGFVFAEIYGEIGDEYIEVHHITPVSRIGSDYIIDPINDLVPLCSNCHSMIHRRDPPLAIEVLKELIKNPSMSIDGCVSLIKIADVPYE